MIMAARMLAPHLVDHRGIKVCSVCMQPFATVSGPSLSLAFRKHVEEAHAAEKKTPRDDAKHAVPIEEKPTEET
jgi:hypothetical protein